MDAMSSTYLNANLAHFYDMVRFSSTQATNTQEVNQSSCFINLLCMFNISTITIKIGPLVLPKDLYYTGSFDINVNYWLVETTAQAPMVLFGSFFVAQNS